MRLGLDLRSVVDPAQREALATEADRLGMWAVLVDSTIEAASLAPLTQHVHVAVAVDATTHPMAVAEAIAVGIRSIRVPIGRNAAVMRISTAVRKNAPTACSIEMPEEAPIKAAPGVDQAVTIGMR